MKRNLIYYCYFENGEINEFTKLNLELLNRYCNLFNGQKIIKIALDDLTKDYSNLVDLFQGFDVEVLQNNKENRESEYFIESVKEIKDTNSITFFAHNKGGSNRPESDVIKLWLFSMYFFNLEPMYLLTIQDQLSNDKIFSGIMQITTPCPPWVVSDWHYSGTFFWFNTQKLLSIENWDIMEKNRFAVESYPGSKIKQDKSHVTMCSANFNFNTYSPEIWKKILTSQSLGQEMFDNFMKIYTHHIKPTIINND
jgi:hypothetical protein